MPMPRPGDLAPDFELPSDAGQSVRLSALRGFPVVLYFYPKDDTPGCTKEACGIRDDFASYESYGAVVLGVSPDSIASHAAFKTKFELPFLLLADLHRTVCDLYGVWGKKSFMGKEYLGVHRTTFLIGRDGRVRNVFENVKADGHSAELLTALQSL
jgi:thioredoxin-dependent peroxiredoxin